MTPFGEKLRELRSTHHVTLRQMADAINVSSAYLSALEHGHRGKAPWMTLQKIIAYFDLIWDDAEELVSLSQTSDPKPVLDTSGLPVQATALANKLASNFRALDTDALGRLEAQLDEEIERIRDA